MSSSKIQRRQRERLAVIYVRQSSPRQVRENRESTDRQYGLAERAQALGWPADNVLTIDCDLGHGAGQAAQGQRRGFAELCRLLAAGRVGGVFGIESSRLARNTVEWFQLLDLCRRQRAALVEADQVYAPWQDDDALVLGIKGTLNAAELSVLQARMEGGRRNKALRGELWSKSPTGFVREGSTIRKDPDRRVQEAIGGVFERFREAGTMRRAWHLMLEADERLPVRSWPGGVLTWREPSYARVRHILENPAMAGVYAYGKRGGHGKRHARRPLSERWDVFLVDNHEGYVGFQEWLEMQATIEGNMQRPGASGAPREGSALLQGLTLCGLCTNSMFVCYNKHTHSYACGRRTLRPHGENSCVTVGGKRIDRAVERLFLEVVTSANVEAAREAARKVAERESRALRRWHLEVERCRYEAALAERRYRQVDPDNRLIASTLEDDWERALVALKRAEEDLEVARRARRPLPPASQFAELGKSLRRVWEAPATSMADRKRMLACLVREVAVHVDRSSRTMDVVVHWRGGRIDEVTLPWPVNIPEVRRDSRDTVELVRNLSRFYPDKVVASVLNRQGRQTARGLKFTAGLVGELRRRQGIPAFKAPPSGGESSDGELVGVYEAASRLGIHQATIYRWIRAGLVPVDNPDVDGAPLRVRMTDEFRAFFRAGPPPGYVRAQVAEQLLSLSRQSIWLHIKSGRLEACHVARGKQRGIYVRIPDMPPLLPEASHDAHS